MYIVSKEKTNSGGNAYSNPQEWYSQDIPNGFAVIPDKQILTVFSQYKGFVTLTIEDDVVTSITPNQEAYDAWMEAHPEPDPLPAAKEARQEENKAALAAWLAEHPLTWADGNPYGVTEADQNEMALNLQQYQVQKAAGREAVLEWHTRKKQCHAFTEEQYTALLLAIIDYVYPYRRYQESVKEAIYNAETMEAVRAVVIDYGSVEAPA